MTFDPTKRPFDLDGYNAELEKVPEPSRQQLKDQNAKLANMGAGGRCYVCDIFVPWGHGNTGPHGSRMHTVCLPASHRRSPS